MFLKENHIRPEQVQDFYPTPGTVSTCMYYTGLDPYTMESVFVPTTPEEKAMQRALLQYFNPKNKQLVLKALRKAKRFDLIGSGKNALIEGTAETHSSSNGKPRPANQKKKPQKGNQRSWQPKDTTKKGKKVSRKPR